MVAHEHPVHGMIYCVLPSKFRLNPTYITVYIHWCYLVVNYFIPFYGLLIFNLLIWAQIRVANRTRQMLSRSEKREIGLATMLLCVVIIFFLFNLLALYVNIREAFFGEIPDREILISNLLVTLNSSVNFIIYVIFGEKFKKIFLQMFCSCLMGRHISVGLTLDDSSFSNGDPNRSSLRFTRHEAHRVSSRHSIVEKVSYTTQLQQSARERIEQLDCYTTVNGCV